MMSNTAPTLDGHHAHRHASAPARAALIAAARAEWFRSIAIVAAFAGLIAADPFLAIVLAPVLIAHGGRAIALARPGLGLLSVILPTLLAYIAALGSGGAFHAATSAILIGGLAGVVGVVATRSVQPASVDIPATVRIFPTVIAAAIVFALACVPAIVLNPVDAGVLLRREVIKPQFDTLAQSCKQAESDGKDVTSCEALSWEKPMSASVTKYPERYVMPAIMLSALLAGWLGLRLSRRFTSGAHARKHHLAQIVAFERGDPPSAEGPSDLPRVRLAVPWWVAYVGIASLVTAYLGVRLDVASKSLRMLIGLGWAGVLGTATVYWSQGACVVSAVFAKLRIGRPLRLLGWVMIVLTPMGIGGVFALGLIDGVVNLRREPSDQDTISGREGPKGP